MFFQKHSASEGTVYLSVARSPLTNNLNTPNPDSATHTATHGTYNAMSLSLVPVDQ